MLKYLSDALPEILNNQTTSELVLSRLQQDIVTGKLKPGMKLNERELTARYGVSRTPLREALQELVRSQLAVMVPYRGAFVREVSFDFARDVYELRAGLEGLASFHAASRASIRQLDKLQQIVNEIEILSLAVGGSEVSQENRDKIVLLNTRFHRSIALAAGNSVLVTKFDEFWACVNLVRFTVWQTNTRTESSYLEHVEILNALRLRQAVRARELCEQHVGRAWGYVTEHLNKEASLEQEPAQHE